jgi:hypothetical protein
MTASQDVSRISEVEGDSVPGRVTGYQGDSAGEVPLNAKASGFCG